MKRITSVTIALLALGLEPAMAQISPIAPIRGPDGSRQSAPRERREAAPPVGVPGARAEPDLTAPAERNLVDMPPNEALFDAINRGDLAASKEAIGRGADIHSRNILGLTPIELAVDLGRNDISFLLLSLRGGAGYGSSKRAAPPAQDNVRESAAERRAEQEARRRQATVSRAAAREEARKPAPPRNAQLFAGDGGSPVPQAGFLGFGATR